MKAFRGAGTLCLRCIRPISSTAAPTPPLLAKIKSDLKVAMKAKDKNRLDVLRALISDASNASKTTSPVNTDLQVLALLRKRSAASKSAAEEFAAAKRSDLKEREESQLAILDEYASQVKTLSKEEVDDAVKSTIQKLQSEGANISMGTVMRGVNGPGGPLEGKTVEKSEVAQVVKREARILLRHTGQ